MGPPTSVTENTPYRLAFYGGSLTVEIPSSQMTLACVKLTKTSQHRTLSSLASSLSDK